jgi:hypothetical protein
LSCHYRNKTVTTATLPTAAVPHVAPTLQLARIFLFVDQRVPLD